MVALERSLIVDEIMFPSSSTSSSSEEEEVETTRRKMVSFGSIECWSFLPTIGDNPSVSCGVPIALGKLQPKGNTVVTIELYERKRKPRRSTRDLKITSQDREDMLLGVGYDLDEINAATKSSRRGRGKLNPSSGHGGFQATLEGTTRKLKGMVHLNSRSSNNNLCRSLAKSRVDEQDADESRFGVRAVADAPPKPGRRRGSLTLGLSSSSDAAQHYPVRSMRRWSSDQHLKTNNKCQRTIEQQERNPNEPPRPTHRRDSFERPSPSSQDQTTSDGGGDFWSRLKDSSPASPQPAQRRRSVQEFVEVYQQGDESSDNGSSEHDMIHYYQYGETSEESAPSPTKGRHPGVSTATRRWSLHGLRRDASPRPGARRSSLKKDDVTKATNTTQSRRRSSFFGGGGSSSAGNRDSQPSPTPRRISMNATNAPVPPTAPVPPPSTGTSTRITPTPARRLSFLGTNFTDLMQWSPTKSDKDDTESTVSVASSSRSSDQLRRPLQLASSSLLGPIPDLMSPLDDEQPPRFDPPMATPRRRSFLGGFRDNSQPNLEPDGSVKADAPPAPRRRKSIFGGILDPPTPLLSQPNKGLQESVGGQKSTDPSTDGLDSYHLSTSASADDPSIAEPTGSGGDSSSGPTKRRSSFLGSILRDGHKPVAAV